MSVVNPITPAKLRQLKTAMPKKQPTHDVTLFPLFDATHHPGPRDTHLGCIDPVHVINVELPGGTFLEALRKGQARGIINLNPGHWLLLEWSDTIEEHTGMVFTVHSDGTVSPQCLADAHLSLATWPPRKLSV